MSFLAVTSSDFISFKLLFIRIAHSIRLTSAHIVCSRSNIDLGLSISETSQNPWTIDSHLNQSQLESSHSKYQISLCILIVISIQNWTTRSNSDTKTYEHVGVVFSLQNARTTKIQRFKDFTHVLKSTTLISHHQFTYSSTFESALQDD